MSDQGVLITTNVPDYTAVPGGIRSVNARILIDLKTRFIVLTSDPNPMLFSIEGRKTDLVKVADEVVLNKNECVAMLHTYLDGFPDIDIVGVRFPFMDRVRQNELVDETHQAIVLYNANADQDGSALMLASFFHGGHRDVEYRIPVEPHDFMLGGQCGSNPPVNPGDVDVIKLFTLPEQIDGKYMYWNWNYPPKRKVFLELRKPRKPQDLRKTIVDRMIKLARDNPLVYVEGDRKDAGVVLAGIVKIEKGAEGGIRHIRTNKWMQSGV